jgi:hypothetical protein
LKRQELSAFQSALRIPQSNNRESRPLATGGSDKAGDERPRKRSHGYEKKSPRGLALSAVVDLTTRLRAPQNGLGDIYQVDPDALKFGR